MTEQAETTQLQLPLMETIKDTVLMLDPRYVEVEEGFNPRTDYGDMEELMERIRENGVRVPTKGYIIKSEGKADRYVITGGHRRLQVCLELIREGVPVYLPFVGGEKPSEEDRLIETIIGNDGKQLNPLEQATVIARLEKLGMERKDIAQKLNITPASVSNMLLLSKVSPNLKKKIEDGHITPSLVIKLVRSKNGLDEENINEKVNELIKLAKADEAAKEIADEYPDNLIAPDLKPLVERGEPQPLKPLKVTQKAINESIGIQPSYVYFSRLLKRVRKDQLEIDKRNEVFEILSNIVDGKYNEEQITELFFD